MKGYVKMNKEFKAFASYVKLHDGYNKPKINFQEMYRLFPDFEFIASDNFGSYSNYGKAFESKNLSMIVKSKTNHECYMNYREYGDADENTAYVS
jgi:hypothetical protein